MSWEIGSIIALAVFLAGVIFKSGHHSARLESLEEWRGNVRKDMHEISDQIKKVSEQLTSLTTMVQERTERRLNIRNQE